MAEQFDKTVLVVDDEPDVIKFLQMALEDNGFTVITANDGLDGIEKARKFKPDLISMDLVMPKHSGAKMYRELQKDAELTISVRPIWRSLPCPARAFILKSRLSLPAMSLMLRRCWDCQMVISNLWPVPMRTS